MNFIKSPALLLNFFIAIMLVISLWTSGVQDFLVPEVQGNCEIELTLDTDSNSNDLLDQDLLISLMPSVLYFSQNADYPKLQARSAPFNFSTPPDRPPAKSV
jgi:hypothetical protein